MKTGETFTFRVSSTATVKGMSFQYCTKAAGLCAAPGNNAGDAHTVPDDRAANGTSPNTSDLDVVGTFTQDADAGALGAGEFQIYVNGVETTATDWTMTVANAEDQSHTDPLTGKNNYITLTSATGQPLTYAAAVGDLVKVVFQPSETVYITNPGAGSFFVKINTYSSDTSLINPINDPTPEDTADQTVIDGGVTVANVMTDSIHITTKVLETMSFSVGTQNPDTQDLPSHGICDNMDVINNNRLNLGDPTAEYSLSTDEAFDVYSYWRLSSNSSGGASVYYSGNTLANTVGDEIKPIGTTTGTPNGAKDYSHMGTEQFGLAFVDAGLDPMGTGTFDPEHITPSLAPLAMEANYADGTGTISDPVSSNNAQFAFDKTSLMVPELIAQESENVISCATAKMRYVANIAADTPAGVYTTKINYLAAPQY